jgi:hypothetical protein
LTLTVARRIERTPRSEAPAQDCSPAQTRENSGVASVYDLPGTPELMDRVTLLRCLAEKKRVRQVTQSVKVGQGQLADSERSIDAGLLRQILAALSGNRAIPIVVVSRTFESSEIPLYSDELGVPAKTVEQVIRWSTWLKITDQIEVNSWVCDPIAARLLLDESPKL